MKRLVPLALLLVGCSSPKVDGLGCAEDAPTGLGWGCAGDGECGDWLVCRADRCSVPAAVAGDGSHWLASVTGDTAYHDLHVEAALSDVARMRGLSHRPCMADGWALALLFPYADNVRLTTRFTRFAIDVFMIGDDERVHTVHRDVLPGSEALIASEHPSKSVLETSAGEFEINVGDRVDIWPAPD